MAAPEYVPVSLNELPRLKEPIPPPGHWKADRPADLKGAQPVGPMLGRPGPDQGYALLLAHRFEDRLVLADGEHAEDVIAGCVAALVIDLLEMIEVAHQHRQRIGVAAATLELARQLLHQVAAIVGARQGVGDR